MDSRLTQRIWRRLNLAGAWESISPIPIRSPASIDEREFPKLSSKSARQHDGSEQTGIGTAQVCLSCVVLVPHAFMHATNACVHCHILYMSYEYCEYGVCYTHVSFMLHVSLVFCMYIPQMVYACCRRGI